MNHVIIGTAGHVDHGKTLLIKALTGIDTDRLQEEKKRGITIELGFAHLDWPDGTQAGIVDVPGHEKFIKNMLAGAGGIDLAMLIVAADDGFMPQTLEHLDILTLLGIKDGCVVITKSDVVDPEWLEMMKEEIVGRVEGTFLEGKPVHCVSAYTGQGIPELRQELHDMVQRAAMKNLRVPFRLPVDRVFSVDGFGTVVTGTLIEGSMHEGDNAELIPGGAATRIRNLQVHGKDVDTAYAGQRVAVNLAGLKKTDIQRGDAVAKPGSVRTSRMLDVRLQNLRGSKRVIQNDSQVHLYHTSQVQLAKVVLLDRDTLNPGESCYAQLRLTDPIATKSGDRFVIRFYSPLETIGGGVILDDAPARHKRFQSAVLEALKIKETGSGGDRVIQVLTEFGTELPTAAKLAAKLRMEETEVADAVRELCARGRAVEPLEGRYASSAVMDKTWDTCREILAGYHKQNPLHAGMKEAEVRQKCFKNLDQTTADALLGALRQEGKLRRVSERYALGDFEIKFTKRQNNIKQKLLQTYQKADLESPATDDVLAGFPQNEKTDAKQVLESLVTGGDLVMLTPQICWYKDTYARVCDVVKTHFESHETITLGELRDLINSSRKYTLAVLEYYDKNRITKKDGDLRYLVGFRD
ncbi:MAG: selenocysteine-specific translation elongation factor [Oscillospiraceae bacterium]|nr:selenocysteine-specific translation elongation factor [Oscillospiraceae bacterium]